ncbi:MAG TPA: MarR family winged helix-turn-helix transcriptional regulator [Spirochaetota bacterium]|nr:MarR family winged helix-turn-helix transcriptional regulator [Spirochaetota bacterium]HOS41272.1 MarR family winged helix-turn-helix transcriptional regulator [Spirochaetota bacterium]HPU88380.1 MarR family winged helix-turn-helix transcriptional regulator [Spirochaetota bacterium]
MDKRIESINGIMQQFLRVVNLFQEVERQPMDFGIGMMLHPSEIHTVDAIGDSDGINVTALAHRLGVTKGAVSQMVTKLKRRGLVNKLKSVDNDRDVVLALTPKGRRAYDAHKRFHLEMYHDFFTQIDDVTFEQIEFFKSIMDKIERYVERHLG